MRWRHAIRWFCAGNPAVLWWFHAGTGDIFSSHRPYILARICTFRGALFSFAQRPCIYGFIHGHGRIRRPAVPGIFPASPVDCTQRHGFHSAVLRLKVPDDQEHNSRNRSRPQEVVDTRAHQDRSARVISPIAQMLD